MSRNPLITLLRLRDAELDDAKRTVAGALVREHAASRRLEVEEAALSREMTMATSMAGGDDCVDAFARWLPIGRKAIGEALIACQVAAAEVDHARTVLTLSRAGHRSVEMLMEKQTLQTAAEAAIRTQREMDDLALRLRSA
ncbi:flagellar FliJ family protein [Lichenicoccus roseus]|uniref:Flagellar FliJ protein n=1 Tax=Lichenicoccus roseus TaxID=2683649 RepID=A0A5R9J3R6_9PROT|nr:flagellar FliJ family protein [Lichenicoccus roseus]TLU71619.1 hypothetical protein FE263_14155 [Lichenicoccus roseus]